MCGFAGFLGGSWGGGPATALLADMARRIGHRGPDHRAFWHDAEMGIGFAHNRLAIVDLSPAGEQPMASPSGRYVIIYNGEIYNHADMRRDLEARGHRFEWRGHSDTETLLAAIETWGLEESLQRAIGMFALALWDRRERRLFLARDRVGEKPLYYGYQGTGANRAFLFGSELKALARHPAFAGELDRGAIALYMRHNYIPAPHSIYRGIAKLLPGSYACIGPDRGEPDIRRYWVAEEMAEAGVANPVELSAEESVEELERLMLSAVGQQMMADVPLGAFLSGGIDSSTVVALMQAQSTRPVKTFSIGFHEKAYNEADRAKAVAQHLGTDHTEMYVTPEQAMAVIPRLAHIYDEPFADSSQVPTFLVSQLARRHVTVSLSGDGGDELFGGYERYAMTDRFWRSMSRVPRPLRQLAARGLTAIPPGGWDGMARLLPARRRRMIGDKIHKGAGLLSSRSAGDLYRGLVSHFRAPERVVIGAAEPATILAGATPRIDGLNRVEMMMALDLLTYLPDDILVKVDRAAMAVSLETRVPLLDHRVIEYAWRLPLAYKIRDGQTKWPLRQLLYKYVPRAMIERPKMGFAVPIDAWLRDPLRDWAEGLLDESRMRQAGVLDPALIHELWQGHLGGSINAAPRLWNVLMFQAWLDDLQAPEASSAPAQLCGAKIA